MREILNTVRLRLAALLRRKRLERDLEDEIAFHLAMREEERRAAGLDPRSAGSAARRRFGNVLALKEACLELWTFRPLEQLVEDLRFALRVLRRDPAFTTVAVLTLALGIGATTAIFALRDATLLRFLPVREPGRLVVPHWIAERSRVTAGTTISGCGEPGDCALSHPLYQRLSETTRSFSGLAAFSRPESVQVGFRGETSLVDAQAVSGNFFPVLGVAPAHGRILASADDLPGSEPVAVLGDAFWRRRFGAEPAAVGRSIVVNGSSLTIVGIAPAGFFGIDPANPPAIWVPLHTAARLESEPGFSLLKRVLDERALVLGTVGRLKPGIEIEAARGELAQRLRQVLQSDTAPVFDPKKPADVVLVGAARGMNAFQQGYGGPLRLLGRLVSLVLVVACANIACLLLARAVTRRREIALRLAIGAGRRRLVAQLLTEGLVLSLLGGAGGLALGFWGSRLLALSLSPGMQEQALAWTHPSAALLGLTAAVVSITTLVFALVPAWSAWRLEPASELQAARTVGRGTRLAGNRAGRVAQWIVAAEVAGTLVLLVGAGLFVRTILSYATFDPGFRADHLLTVEVSPVVGADAGAVSAEVGALGAWLGGLAGVESVTWSSSPFLGGSVTYGMIMPDSGNLGGYEMVASFSVGPRFFRTMGMPLIAGRDVAVDDLREGAPSVWISRSLAERRFPGRDPIGARLGADGRVVVGVVPDTSLGYLGLPPSGNGTMYVARLAEARCFLLRTSVLPLSLARSVQTIAHDVAPRLLVRGVADEAQRRNAQAGHHRLLAAASLALGGLTLLLAAVGLYGVLSYSVSRRRGEIAIRMSLGAVRADIFRLVLGEGSRVVLAGATLGAVGAYWTTRSFTHFLFGVRPLDPVTYAAAALVLAGVAGLAAYLPASRASHVDPAAALRAE